MTISIFAIGHHRKGDDEKPDEKTLPNVVVKAPRKDNTVTFYQADALALDAMSRGIKADKLDLSRYGPHDREMLNYMFSSERARARQIDHKWHEAEGDIAEFGAELLAGEGLIFVVGKVARGVRLWRTVRAAGIAKTEFSTIYRAVSKAELSDIIKYGFRNKAGAYETGKLFAPTLEEAAKFGKNNFMFDGIPNTIMKVRIPNSILNDAYKFGADGMDAISIPTHQLNLLRGEPLNYSPFIH